MVFTHKGEKVNYYPIMTSGHKDRSLDKPTKKEQIYIVVLRVDNLNMVQIKEEMKDIQNI